MAYNTASERRKRRSFRSYSAVNRGITSACERAGGLRHATQYQEDLPVVTHEVLASVLRTIQQRQLNASVVFSDLLRAQKPITALAPPPRLQ